MDEITDLRNQLAKLYRSHQSWQRLNIVAWGCLLLTFIVGAAAVTTFMGDVEVRGNLAVVGKVNGVDVNVGEVKLGMMLPYFGAGEKPPRGYCWADGTTPWPDAPWVPSHLHGQKVPNMNGELLGGTTDVLEVTTPSIVTKPELAVTTSTSGEILWWRRGGPPPTRLNGFDQVTQIEGAS